MDDREYADDVAYNCGMDPKRLRLMSIRLRQIARQIEQRDDVERVVHGVSAMLNA